MNGWRIKWLVYSQKRVNIMYNQSRRGLAITSLLSLQRKSQNRRKQKDRIQVMKYICQGRVYTFDDISLWLENNIKSVQIYCQMLDQRSNMNIFQHVAQQENVLFLQNIFWEVANYWQFWFHQIGMREKSSITVFFQTIRQPTYVVSSRRS